MATYYEPKLQLIINGVVIAGYTTANPNVRVDNNVNDKVATIETMNIRGGRSDVTAQPTAMQCSVDIVTSTSFADSDCSIGAALVINVYNPYTSAWTPLFTGLISDKELSLRNWSNGSGIYQYSFSAYSRLASFQLAKQNYAGGSTVLSSTASASERINEVLGGWQYSGSWIGGINTDTVLLHRRNGGIASTYFDYDVIESAALSARGCFHDRADGKVYYNNYAGTIQATITEIDNGLVIAGGVSVTRSITDIYTVCQVESTNDAVSTQQASSTGGQISAYGKRYGVRSTELQTQSVMLSQAQAFLVSRQNPRWRPSAFTIDLGLIPATETFTPSTYFQVRTNSRYTLRLPAPMTDYQDCLVDNWAWSFSRGRMFLEMQLSNALDTHAASEL